MGGCGNVGMCKCARVRVWERNSRERDGVRVGCQWLIGFSPYRAAPESGVKGTSSPITHHHTSPVQMAICQRQVSDGIQHCDAQWTVPGHAPLLPRGGVEGVGG